LYAKEEEKRKKGEALGHGELWMVGWLVLCNGAHVTKAVKPPNAQVNHGNPSSHEGTSAGLQKMRIR